MGEEVTEGTGGRPVAFLPWVTDEQADPARSRARSRADHPGASRPGSAPVGDSGVDRIAELSAHVARRSPSAISERDASAHDGRSATDASAAEEADVETNDTETLDTEAFDAETIDPEQIADRIVRGLSRKSLSVAEVEARLYTEGVAEKDALEIVERFTRFGYLDDYRMAEELVASLRERKKLGRSSIQQELRSRKLDPEAVATALDELDGDDEYRTALELARKRLPSLRSLSDEVAERRLTGFLARRGYAGALVQRVVRETVRRPGSSVRFH
ncbi:regulatory protein [Rathayibacter oskolensis]|uniref:Regulatory protein RecX n=1 Tax=Rathayibacter oskolensis TaxID=1891671 RepID=A0A1X7P8V4_9MICO|nr:regulatory protein RecX [Rathayibacter oskolensis]SMH47503.1 regulatory protein [Rathayibacter oskolensis]